ncbi:MAG: hypothetical protein Kow006_09580 [Gammaproteobacteria bacterium]
MRANNEQRRRHYIDYQIQRWMIVGLIALEVLLLGWAVLALYNGLSDAVNEQLYLIHGRPASDRAPLFIDLALEVLGAILLINVVALVIADLFWGQYVRWILRQYHQILARLTELDFRDPGDRSRSHRLIELLESWRVREEEVWREIRAGITSVASPIASERELTGRKERLNHLLEYLKKQRR